MPTPDSPPSARPSKRRWLRLSLRGLMVLVLLLAVGLGYFLHLVRVQRDAVRAIKRTGSGVQRRWTTGFTGFLPGDGRPWLIRWLERHVEPDYFDPVIRVDLGEQAGDAEMDHVARLSHLETFTERGSQVTDAGLARLGKLPYLEQINLISPVAVKFTAAGEPIFTRQVRSAARDPSPRITGTFLHAFAGLTRLKFLAFDGALIRDANLAGIAGLTQLDTLDLSATGITDAGLVHLQGLTGLTSLVLKDNPGITSAGLVYLGRLKNLTNLNLDRTAVRDLTPLASLPGCWNIRLAGTPITDADLAPLAQVTHLKNLYLPYTAVTGAGLAPLRDLAELRMVVLATTGVTDADVATLLELPALQWVNLAGTVITDAGLDRLGQSKTLQVLDLTDTAVTDVGIARLLAAVPLIGLNLENARLTPATQAQLLQVRPTLKFNGSIVR